MLGTVVDFGYLIYRWLTPLKNAFLIQHFGYVSHCKHQLTCSQYLRQATHQEGFKGFCKGIKRILACH